MGYIDSSGILEIDGVLTQIGKEILAKDPSKFVITKFAIADDEVDYSLWNPDHSLGSDYYGEMIEGMPVLEANPNESQTLKYKLVTLDRDTRRVPVVDIGQDNVTLKSSGQIYTVSPTTINFENGNETLGYTAILSDSNVATMRVTPGFEVNIDGTPTTTISSNTESITVIGKKFDIIAKQQAYVNASTTVTIIGNETGGISKLQVTVLKENTATMQPIIA